MAEPMHRKLPIQARGASLRMPESMDADDRTVELMWSTGAKVRRTDFWTGDTYFEELSLDPNHVRMDRLNSGAPLLNSHDNYDLRGVIGVVVDGSARIEDGEAHAQVRFSKRSEIEPIFQDVKDGVIRNVSVGYVVHKYEVERSDDKDAPPTYRAIDWEPMELSLVPIGADPTAGVRSEKFVGRTFECEVVINRSAATEPREEEEMKRKNREIEAPAAVVEPDENPAIQTAPEEPEMEIVTDDEDDDEEIEVQPEAPRAADPIATREETVRAERARVVSLQELAVACHRVNDGNVVDLPARLRQWINTGTSVEAASREFFAEIAKQGDKNMTTGIVRGGRDESVTRAAAIENALLHRYQPGRYPLDEEAREYRGLTMVEIARIVLRGHGEDVRGRSKLEIAQRALHSTSDFPAILANVANKTLRRGYEESPRTYVPWTRASTAPDFKEIRRTQLSAAPVLTKVNESGEFTYGALTDGKEIYQLGTYGKVLGLTRQAIVNDDLSALTRIPQMLGQAAARLESDIVWAILTANAAMADAVALFHATHGNLGTGAIAVAGLNTGRLSMRKQTGMAGEILNITPRYLLVPAALETVSQQFVVQNVGDPQVAEVATNRNPFLGTLTVIVEPRLDATSAAVWYLAADPEQVDTVEYATLEGEGGPMQETQMGFDIDGVKIKIRHDFAAKAIDHRGLYKSTGV